MQKCLILQNNTIDTIFTMGIFENIIEKVLNPGLSFLNNCDLDGPFANYIKRAGFDDSLQYFRLVEWPTFQSLIAYSAIYGICAVLVLLALWGLVA